MNALETEQIHLAKADKDIVEGEQRLARQALLVETLARDGRPTETARDLLKLLVDTLANWREHRELILQRIEVLKQRGAR